MVMGENIMATCISSTSSLFESWGKISATTKKKLPSFVPNDLVYLKKGLYEPHPTNPAIGSTYECSGKILSITYPDSVQVLWSNGMVNVYQPTQLMLKKKYLPITDGCKSIW